MATTYACINAKPDVVRHVMLLHLHNCVQGVLATPGAAWTAGLQDLLAAEQPGTGSN